MWTGQRLCRIVTQLSHGPIKQGLANISLLPCFHLQGEPIKSLGFLIKLFQKHWC